MKKLTLEDAWWYCLDQWDFMKELGYEDVGETKRLYLEKHGLERVRGNCFFCEYDIQNNDREDCSQCPATMVDEIFCCNDAGYNFYDDPAEFHKRIISLNKRRLAKCNL